MNRKIVNLLAVFVGISLGMAVTTYLLVPDRVAHHIVQAKHELR